MQLNPYVVERLAEERMKDVRREAERARLVREAQAARATGRLADPGLLARMQTLVGRLFAGRPVNPRSVGKAGALVAGKYR